MQTICHLSSVVRCIFNRILLLAIRVFTFRDIKLSDMPLYVCIAGTHCCGRMEARQLYSVTKNFRLSWLQGREDTVIGLSVIAQRTLCTLAGIDPRLFTLLSVTEPNVPVHTRWDQPFKTQQPLSIIQRIDIQINSRTSVLGTGIAQWV